MAFICGSFNNQDQEDDFEVLWPTTSPPSRKPKRHKFCCKRSKLSPENNPYSNRGLEKFEALLADLDDKKQKIFTQKGSHYISFVRFVYSNSNDEVKPIIVKLKDPRKIMQDRKKNNFKETKSISLPNNKILKPSTSFNHHHHHRRQNSEPPGAHVVNSSGMILDTRKDVKSKKPYLNDDGLKWNFRRKLEEWWMPAYNLVLFVILVLVFLTFFGRSLAIICTSIAWYLIPTVDGTLENTSPKPKKKMIKNEKTSEININSPKGPKPFFSGPIDVQQKRKMNKLMSF